MLLSILPVLCKYAHHESGISALALLDCRTKVPLMLTWFLMSPRCVAAVYVLFNFARKSAHHILHRLQQ